MILVLVFVNKNIPMVIKRFFWFSAVNIAVLLLIYFILSTFRLEQYLVGYGLNYFQLLFYSAIFGFAGSFISLFSAKWLVKRIYKITIITEPANSSQKWLLTRVVYYAKAMKIAMPEVGVYESSEVNAFATGASKNSALVAFSVGLLESMNQEEADGVIGHEVAHIANGDMVTMALIQGVVNTFVIFLSRIAATIVSKILSRGSERGAGLSYYLIVIFFQIIFGILASPIVYWFSRQREFRADADSAKHGSKVKMIGGLKKLQLLHGNLDTAHPEIATMKISGKDIASLFSTHPPLAERIRRLEAL